jgi:hypothetical protein
MPIINNGWKREAFLRKISLHLTGNPKFGETTECDEQVVYFGGGYWRGKMMPHDAGVILFNPSNSRAEAKIVEEALCILLCGRFQP